MREKGFDAVEPDNIEGFANRSGFPLTAQQQLTFNEWVAQEAHSLGMAVLQKNDGEQTPQLQPYFDGALTEQCNQYRECAGFPPYSGRGQAGPQRRVPSVCGALLRRGRCRRHHGRPLRPRARRALVRALLVRRSLRAARGRGATIAR